MMAADYRHIGSLENRLGRHYSRFLAFWPAPALAGQSLALRKLCDAGSNRRSRVSGDQVEVRHAAPKQRMSLAEVVLDVQTGYHRGEPFARLVHAEEFGHG